MSSGLPIGSGKCKPPAALADENQWLHMFGDVNFIEYGGQILLPDHDGVPYLEVVVPPCDDEAKHGSWLPTAKWEVYRVEPERKKMVEVDRVIYLVCEAWAPDWTHPLPQYDEWFHEDLKDIASCVGRPMQEIRDDICSPDPVRRSAAYIDMAAYWGWYEFDQYPLSLTQHEVHERYGMVAECECADCEQEREREINRAAMCDWKAYKAAQAAKDEEE